MIGPKSVPKNMIIELTNRCNLRCPVCTTYLDMRRPKGFMSWELYQRIVDELVFAGVKRLNFNFAGEPYLHNGLEEFVNYAHDLGFKTMVSTNATIYRPPPRGLDDLMVCLDGFTRKAHEAYRVGSKFFQVKENIERMCKEKGRTRVCVQTLLTSYSENHVDRIESWARRIGADLVVFKRPHSGHLGEESRFLPRDKSKRRKGKWRPVCRSGLVTGLIYWNGEIGMCCVDFNNMANTDGVYEHYKWGITDAYNSSSVARKRLWAFLKLFPECRKCELSGAGGLRWKEVGWERRKR